MNNLNEKYQYHNLETVEKEIKNFRKHVEEVYDYNLHYEEKVKIATTLDKATEIIEEYIDAMETKFNFIQDDLKNAINEAIIQAKNILVYIEDLPIKLKDVGREFTFIGRDIGETTCSEEE